MTNAINQLFRPKYVRANRTSGGRIAATGDGCSVSGEIPATVKKRCAEHHADNAGAAMLKRGRYISSWRFAIQYEPTRPSSATMTVPAAGPYSKTAVKTNVSEIEIEANV